MENLKTLENEIIKILKKIPEARNSDMILYYEYCLQNWVREYEMWRVFKCSDFRKQKNVSVFESVSRARRKVQEKYPELRSTEEVENFRKEKEEEFIKYAKGK